MKVFFFSNLTAKEKFLFIFALSSVVQHLQQIINMGEIHLQQSFSQNFLIVLILHICIIRN